MTPPFRYPDEDWLPIKACLMKLVPHAEADVCAYWRDRIEATVHAYLWRMAHLDPRSPEQIAVKACWAKIAKHAHALHAAVDKLEAIDPHPAGTLKLTIAFAAANLMEPDAHYLDWKNQSAEAARLAAREAKGFKKSARGYNRSRGAALDNLFAMLLRFGSIGAGALAREAIARRRDL